MEEKIYCPYCMDTHTQKEVCQAQIEKAVRYIVEQYGDALMAMGDD